MRIIILAAGKGKRMDMDLPKVCAPLAGKTLIQYSVDHALASGVDTKPLIVTGYKAEQVAAALKGYEVEFAHQEEQLGTAHAVKICQPNLDPAEDIMVLYGDHSMVDPFTIRQLSEAFQAEKPALALVTYTVPDFAVYEGAFQSFGRILRDETGAIRAIREHKDATPEELKIQEINPAFYAFSGSWLWSKIHDIQAGNAQQEYYLTDLVEMAIVERAKVVDIQGGDLVEAIGINTQEHLVFVENLLKASA